MKKLAPVFVLLAGCCWATLGMFVRHLNELGLHSMEMVEIRAALTALLMVLFLTIFRRDLLRIKGKDLWCFVGGGLISIILFNFCYFQTVQITSLSTAAILLYTSPIFVLLFSVPLFGEKLTKKKVFCLVLAFFGCALASGLGSGSGGLTPMVLLLGLGAGFGYAMYSIFSRFALLRGYHPITITVYVFLFAALGGLMLADFSTIAAVAYQPANMLYLIFYAVITTIVPFIAYTTGLRHIENGIAAVLACIEPVMATIFGIFVFGEWPTIAGWLGILLVLTALMLLNRQPEKKED